MTMTLSLYCIVSHYVFIAVVFQYDCMRKALLGPHPGFKPPVLSSGTHSATGDVPRISASGCVDATAGDRAPFSGYWTTDDGYSKEVSVQGSSHTMTMSLSSLSGPYCIVLT